jgi:hypothetical protein
LDLFWIYHKREKVFFFWKLTQTFGSFFNRLITKSRYSTRPANTAASPKRGDHVINNSVLRVYRDIIDGFLEAHLHNAKFDGTITDLGDHATSSPIYKDHNHPISDTIQKEIQTEMVVHFPKGHPYQDANAGPYGETIKKLRTAAIAHMKELYDGLVAGKHLEGTKSTKAVKDAIANLNSHELYVDTIAKDYYLKYHTDKKAVYNGALKAVHSMFASLYDKLKLCRNS